jgi:S-adenosylmethionine/arginine decarboxylase-like enzyme
MLEHKHLIIVSKIKNSKLDTDLINKWIKDLIEKIEMKILHGPVTIYCDKEGNKGVTGFAIIETSHIALHIWDEEDPGSLQLDVYTCSELDPNTVFQHLEIFKPVSTEWKFLDRKNGMNEIPKTPEQVVKEWLVRISKKHDDLGRHSICPFARMPRVVAVEKLALDNVLIIDDNITIYMEKTISSSYEEIESICRKLKAQYPDYIFLPDHPETKNFIGKHETGNKYYPCIIVQTRKELEQARKSLEKSNYYTFWSREYLDEIKSFN